jgi:hypothetical protein
MRACELLRNGVVERTERAQRARLYVVMGTSGDIFRFSIVFSEIGKNGVG